MTWSNLAGVFDGAGRLAAIGIGLSIPISTAADNVLLAVVAVSLLAGGRYRKAYSALKTNPVFIAALALFGAFVAGTLYGPAPMKEAGAYLLKYVDLLFIPVIAAFFRDPATRRLGLTALAAAIALTVLLSSALYTGLVPRGAWFVHDLDYPVPFKHSLTHAILMGYGAFLFVQLGQAPESKSPRWLWYALAAAAVLNMIFLVPGRTGYVILGTLALYWGYSRWRWTGLATMLVASVLASLVAYGTSGPFRDRVDRALQEYSSWRPGTAAEKSDSVGLRLEFHRNSLQIIRDHPLTGVGTGGFPGAYAKQVEGTGMLPARNPHNEYLMIAVQLGIGGLLLMLYLYYVQWREAPRLASPLETHLARGLVLTIAVGCLFNSLLLDHTEGLLYAWLTGLLYAGLKSKSP